MTGTRLCKIHANIQLMADKLLHHKVIKTSNIKSLIESLCCQNPIKECMYRECPHCQAKELETGTFDPGEQTHWMEWKTKAEEREKKKKDGTREKFTAHLTVKDRVYGTLQTLLEDFTTNLKDKFGRHVFNIQHQYSVLRSLKQDVGENDIILHIDFAENYLCKYASEIQAVHFGDSHKQVSLHTAVAYTANGIISLCSISSSMQHDPPAIWAHISPVLTYLREVTPSASTLHVVSDGPTTQYCSKKDFFLLCTVPFKLGFNKVTWNFLEAGHGKGPADGIGAAIKRTADDIVSKGMDLPNGKVVYETLKRAVQNQALLHL